MAESKNLIHASSADEQNQHMERYYQLQSKIYDATRWSFLFGRRRIISLLPLPENRSSRVLDIGCGTGFNSAELARQYPQAEITAVDVSSSMVARARKRVAPYGQRVQVKHQPYGPGMVQDPERPDALLFSYSLTMINPHWADLIRQAKADLRPGGWIGVADFHDSRFGWFKRHMSNHHVRMDGHLLPVLQEEFEEIRAEVKPAYGGVWHYVLFVGRK